MKQHAANYSPHGLIYPGIYQPLPDKEREISRQLRRKGGVKLHPASRIFKENGLYRIEVPAPGFSKEDFVVYTNGPLLSINGKRKKLPEPETKNLAEEASMEEAIAWEVSLPADADTDFVAAECRNGTLYLYVYRSLNPSPKHRNRVVVY